MGSLKKRIPEPSPACSRCAVTKVSNSSHVDGARLANALAAQGLSFSVMRDVCDVDVMTLGGTKLGMLGAEAVIVFNETLKERSAYLQKQAMQMASKMRFIA